jgi:hypothetical protein
MRAEAWSASAESFRGIADLNALDHPDPTSLAFITACSDTKRTVLFRQRGAIHPVGMLFAILIVRYYFHAGKTARIAAGIAR